jgi:DNA-binding transcriptional MerR regulator
MAVNRLRTNRIRCVSVPLRIDSKGPDVAWSTRELADLAGTTVNTIRHYHRLGLLDEPERRNNGYKQYGVPHLVCLLRIRRMVELGVPLFEIGVARTNGDVPAEVLRQVDAQLAAEIERLTKARADIAVILSDGAPADSPAGFASVAPRMSEADQSLIHVYTRLYDDDAMKDLQHMAENDDHAVNAEMDALGEDADEATRQDLAERLAPVIAQNLTDYPWLNDPGSRLAKSENVTMQTFIDSVVALYNPAQIDVLTRASLLAHQQLKAAADNGAKPQMTDGPPDPARTAASR